MIVAFKGAPAMIEVLMPGPASVQAGKHGGLMEQYAFMVMASKHGYSRCFMCIQMGSEYQVVSA